MEKRVTFKGIWLPLLLVLPQILITAIFFFYPAGQAIWQSLFIPDPFGLSMKWVGLGNFEYLLGDKFYRASFVTTAVFSTLVTVVSMGVALYLAVLADRLIKGSGVYRTLLIWPYAVAPAVAGVLWLFMFNTRIGVVTWYLGLLGYDWNYVLNEGEAMGLVVAASAWGRISYNFLFFLAGLQAIPRSVIEAAAIDGARFWARFRTIVWPLLSPTTFFLLVVNIIYAFFRNLRRDPHDHQWWAATSDNDLSVQSLFRRVCRPRFGVVCRSVCDLAGDRIDINRDPIQIHRTTGALLMADRGGMVENRGAGRVLTHLGLILGIAVIFFPIWLAFVASTVDQQDIISPPMPLWPGDKFLENYSRALTSGINAPVARMLMNSMIMAMGIAVGKIIISLLSAFAIVYFRFPGRKIFFWLIFLTLMLPVEVRIVPTFEVIASFGMLNSYSGLILPLIASATATFLFRQFFMTVPDELAEAARVDGAKPMRFFIDILLPMSRTNIAALFVILFIFGWNQYLWPLLITTDPEMNTIVMGIKQMFPSGDDFAHWPTIMATSILAMVPPVIVVIGMQRLFIRGLVESEK